MNLVRTITLIQRFGRKNTTTLVVQIMLKKKFWKNQTKMMCTESISIFASIGEHMTESRNTFDENIEKF